MQILITWSPVAHVECNKPTLRKKQHLWWTWGRKWEILRWRWWPFGAVNDIYDFVCSHKGKEELAEVEFVWEGDCVVHVVD